MSCIYINKYPLILTFICFLTACCVSLPAHSQQTDFYGNASANNEVCFEGSAHSYDQQVQQLVADLCERIGLKNRYIIRSCSNISNCEAKMYKGQFYILYNSNYLFPVKTLNFSYSSELPKINDQKRWDILGVLAHELGHHTYLHLTNAPEGMSQIQKELEADEYMGRAMALMGATLEQTLAVLNAVPEHGNGYTHPARERRQEAAKKGYEKALQQFPDKKIKEEDKAVLQQLQLAREHYDKKEYDKAFPIFYTYRMHNQFSGYDMCSLATMYYFGRGVQSNLEDALKWSIKAAALGSSYAINDIGINLWLNKRALDKAKEWLTAGAVLGSTAAMSNLSSLLYQLGEDISAFEWKIKSTVDDTTSSDALSISNAFELGKDGAPQDFFKAKEWLEKAVSNADTSGSRATAAHNLGYFYQYGFGCVKDTSSASKYFRLAAKLAKESGDEDTEYCAKGWMYYYGYGVEQDYTKAMSLFNLGVSDGWPEIDNVIGNMYYYGQGVSRDYIEAKKWYEKAAAQNYCKALYNLGWMYEHGDGVIRNDHQKAAEYYKKAASQGLLEAIEAYIRLGD